MNLRFITPTTPAGLSVYRQELEFLNSAIPFSHWSQEDPDGYIEAVAGNLTLVFLDWLLIGCFILEPYRRSVELHGITRPDLKSLLCPRDAQRLLLQIYTLFFDRVFVELGKSVVVAKIPPEARGALGFLRRWGFKRINREGRETVWALSKDRYLEKLSGKQETAKGQSLESHVGVLGD